MAKKTEKEEEEKRYFSLQGEKKQKLAGFLMIVFAVLLMLSIFSYSAADKNLLIGLPDLFKVFSSDLEYLQRAANVQNWLGLFGAYLSDFFVNSTIGFSAIVFPVIIFLWGFSILTESKHKYILNFTNFLIATGFIFSSFFGLLRKGQNLLSDYGELSGKVGDFLGTGIHRLLGTLGGIIVIFVVMIVILFISFDLKIEKIFLYLKNAMIGALSDDEKKEEGDTTIRIKQPDKTETVTEEAKPKKKRKIFGKSDDDKEKSTENDDEKHETSIRIIRKDESSGLSESHPEKILTDPQILKAEPKSQKINLEDEKNSELPDQWDEKIDYKFPHLDLLSQSTQEEIKIPEQELKRNAELLKEKLLLFDIKIDDISVTPGPVVTLYEIVPSPGVKISRIVSLENDIALALAARGIRIIAPIPGKSAIGVEIPNEKATLVSARSVISEIKKTKFELPLALGKTIIGDVHITDLATMPHLLIAGSTGSGKSVGINLMITSLIYSKHPSEVKFVIIDPKKIELSFYKKLNKHFLAVSPDLDEEIITTPSNALLALKAVEFEMEKRYDKLAKAGVRNIVDYNNKVTDPKRKPSDTESMKHYKLPYIIVIIDELADLMMTSGHEVEEPIARLAQLARAVGIHLIVATQRPSVNVITGVIKANFSARIAYQVATRIDSRTILDMNGAEQLLGRGDMLFLPGGLPKPVRIQNAFITTDDVEKVTNFIYAQKGYSKRYFLPSLYEKKSGGDSGFLSDLDPMFEDAARVIVRHQQGSVSLLQRKLKLGYSRAARIMDQLEQAGVVGMADGSKAREVKIESEDQLEALLRAL
jgi:S-DNA-T family DNA segregation ATPase FtsK/SpoIIIE